LAPTEIRSPSTGLSSASSWSSCAEKRTLAGILLDAVVGLEQAFVDGRSRARERHEGDDAVAIAELTLHAAAAQSYARSKFDSRIVPHSAE
jgi:hypothetical protein